MKASFNGCEKVVELLLTAGAKVDLQDKVIYSVCWGFLFAWLAIESSVWLSLLSLTRLHTHAWMHTDTHTHTHAFHLRVYCCYCCCPVSQDPKLSDILSSCMVVVVTALSPVPVWVVFPNHPLLVGWLDTSNCSQFLWPWEGGWAASHSWS